MTDLRARSTPPRRSVAACLTALLCACHDQPTGPPDWPVEIQLRLVNTTADAVFIRATGNESLYTGVAGLAPGDSACSAVYAFADSVPVEVHSWSNAAIVYGSAWIYPLRSAGWHAVVGSGGVAVAPGSACL